MKEGYSIFYAHSVIIQFLRRVNFLSKGGYAVDRQIIEKFLGQHIQIINDEYFVKDGIIEEIYESSFKFIAKGKTYYLSFNRILEIRPLGGHYDF